jgi:hypothetical protein
VQLLRRFFSLAVAQPLESLMQKAANPKGACFGFFKKAMLDDLQLKVAF